jgi:hypothetical protein
MTVSALNMPRVEQVWFKGLFGNWRFPQCVQRFWEWLKLPEHNGMTRIKIKDWELGMELGIGRSCVQKTLAFAEELGLIGRTREYGPEGGRVIVILPKLKGPRPKPPARTAPAARSTAAGRLAPSPSDPDDLVKTIIHQLSTHGWVFYVDAAGVVQKRPDVGRAHREWADLPADLLRDLAAHREAIIDYVVRNAPSASPPPPVAAPAPAQQPARRRPRLQIPDEVYRAIEEQERLRRVAELARLEAIPSRTDREEQDRARLEGELAGKPPDLSLLRFTDRPARE